MFLPREEYLLLAQTGRIFAGLFPVADDQRLLETIVGAGIRLQLLHLG